MNDSREAEPEAREANDYWPFENLDQYNLAKFLSYPKMKSDRIIKSSAVERHCSWIKEGCGFRSVKDFKRRINLLEPKGGEWFSAPLMATEEAYSWVPATRQFYFKNTMTVLKDVVGDPKLAQYMKWVPQRLYDESGRRVYTDIWNGDWWWRLQVNSIQVCC